MAASHPSRGEIAAGQLEQLGRLTEIARSQSVFYKAKLSAMPAKVASLEEFSRWPTTTKQELSKDQVAHAPFGTNLTRPIGDYVRFHQTSGTQGSPLRWLDAETDWQWMTENWAEVFKAAKVGKEDRVLFTFSFGPFIGFWLAFDAAKAVGALCIPAGGMTSQARLGMLVDNAATVLCCTPTYALRLAEVAATEKISLSKSQLKTIVVAGEAGGSIPATRRRLEQCWPGVRIFDHHGMTEVGPVTFECPENPGRLHVMERSFVAEIIEPVSGEAVQPGELGELVLTPLGRLGMPLLRYRTGDLVRASMSLCSCGRADLALEGGILGRCDDMVIVRGVNIHPSAVETIVRNFDDIVEYQAVVAVSGSMTELSLRIEGAPDCANITDVAAALEKKLHATFNLRIPISIVKTGELPRFEMKSKRWVKQS